MSWKIKRVYETEVFVNEGGEISITQEDPQGEPALIILPRDRVDELITYLRLAAQEIDKQLGQTSTIDHEHGDIRVLPVAGRGLPHATE